MAFSLPSFSDPADAQAVLLSRLAGQISAVEHMQQRLAVMAAYSGARAGVADKLAEVLAKLEDAQAKVVEAVALQATG